jgi:hypothetical protein
MTIDTVKSQGDSEVFRFGGFGTVLLISPLAFIGLRFCWAKLPGGLREG